MHILKQQLCHIVLVFILLLSEASAVINFDTDTTFKGDMNVSMAVTDMGNCIQCLNVSEMSCNHNSTAACDGASCSSGQCNNLIENPSFQANNTLSENTPGFQTLIYHDYYFNLIPRPPSTSI